VVDGVKAASSEATTTFVTDANVVATSVSLPSYTPRSLYMAASDNYMQDIITYLQKPQLVTAGNFTSSDTVSSFAPVATAFPFFYSGINMWVEKVRGFFGIRFDLSFRLVVNATRFQQGRYMLLWKPFGGSDSASSKNQALMAGHVMHLIQRTQMPHAEIDINCDTEIEFKIPFSNQYNFCHIRSITTGNQYNSLGIIQIYPYVPLSAVAGALTCGYSLYVSAENIELISAAAPQSGRFTTSRKGKNETNKEQDSADIGPISSIMAKVSSATSVLTGVPVLSSYATSVGWLADIVGRTASVFGYSRPINLMPIQRMNKEIFPYIANADGPDNSVPLALSYKNELAPMTGISPTDLDEMDFTFLCTIPVYDRIINWSTANATGTALASWGVGPCATAVATTTVNALVVNHIPPYRFVSTLFKFWRGTFVYKFKIVKTEFHSGRLSFSFTPRTTSQNLATTPPVIDLPYLHREIVDIRIDNEVTFKVPFVSDTPWKHVIATGSDDMHITGIFSVHVVDPLIAPDTVDQKISIILEMSMAPDVEFSVPYPTILRTPFYGGAPQMGAFDGSSKPEANSCNEITTSIGTMNTLDDSNNSALLCIGEKISNLRKYMRRANPLLFTTSAAATIGNRLDVTPFGITMASQNGVANVLPTVSCDTYSCLASFYLYSRGSVRLKYVNANVLESTINQTTPGAIGYFSPKFVYKLISTPPPNGNDLIDWSAATQPFFEPDINLIMTITSGKENQEFQIPHYHRLPLRHNFDHALNSQYNYSTHVGVATGAATELWLNRNLIELSNSTLDSVPTRIFRGTADDCTLSYFLSIPPMFALAANF
jgi:hypothetical protein